jgi:hypothetical protein
VFNGPNSMTLNNETSQEAITFTRVTARWPHGCNGQANLAR